MTDDKTLAAPRTFPLMAPDALAASAAEAVRQIQAEAASANTTRSYRSALQYWAAWYQGRFGRPIALPVTEAAVVQFIVDHVERFTEAGGTCGMWELPPALDAQLVAAKFKRTLGAFKLSTVVHRVAALSSAHQFREQFNPCEQTAVRHLLAQASRAAVKRDVRPKKKTAIVRAGFEALIDTCDNSLQGIRDRALLYFAFSSGGRRRSEVAAANLKNLRLVGLDEYAYTLLHSKTQQAGPTATSTPDKPIVGLAGQAMTEWLQASGLSEGAVFRRLWKDRIGNALSPAAVGAIVQRRAKKAGLEGDFGGHSLRSGFITEAVKQGHQMPEVMAMTDHRTVASVIGYFQAGNAKNNPAARLFDD